MLAYYSVLKREWLVRITMLNLKCWQDVFIFYSSCPFSHIALKKYKMYQVKNDKAFRRTQWRRKHFKYILEDEKYGRVISEVAKCRSYNWKHNYLHFRIPQKIKLIYSVEKTKQNSMQVPELTQGQAEWGSELRTRTVKVYKKKSKIVYMTR